MFSTKAVKSLITVGNEAITIGDARGKQTVTKIPTTANSGRSLPP
jgi:hypothetical protein